MPCHSPLLLFSPPSSFLSLRSILLLFTLLLHSSAPVSASSLASFSCSANLTLERCSVDSDCNGFGIAPTHVCAGRAQSSGSLSECDKSTNRTEFPLCVCYPFAFRYCDSDADCNDQTYCGTSPRTGNQICVGCLVLTDPDVDFVPVDPVATARNCPAVRPPCGLGLDLCSVSMPCESPYDCATLENDPSGNTSGDGNSGDGDDGVNANSMAITREQNQIPYRCSQDSTTCTCLLVESGNASSDDSPSKDTIALTSCTSDADCTPTREACAWEIQLGRNLCASCDAIDQSSYLLLNDTSKCDALYTIEPKRSPPSRYVLSPNGRTFDKCEDDVQCTNGRKCMRFATFSTDDPSSFDPSQVVPCSQPLPSSSSDPPFCFCRPEQLQECRSGSDCHRGETCATSERVGAERNCVSNRLLDIISNNNFEVHGGRRDNGGGSGRTWDKCQFDWDCKGPRRCTSLAEPFGGCAGRRSCVCRDVHDRPCATDSDCADADSESDDDDDDDGNEVCVNYIDGYTTPFCVSNKVLDLYPYIARVDDDASSVPTPIPTYATGLTDDPCLTDNDCLAPRKCTHGTQRTGSCDGRRFCVCRPVLQDGKSMIDTCKYTRQDCVPGEVCVADKGAVPLSLSKFCTSEAAFDASPVKSFRREFGRRHPSMAMLAAPTEDPV